MTKALTIALSGLFLSFPLLVFFGLDSLACLLVGLVACCLAPSYLSYSMNKASPVLTIYILFSIFFLAIAVSNMFYGNIARLGKYFVYYLAFVSMYLCALKNGSSRLLIYSIAVFLFANVIASAIQLGFAAPFSFQPRFNLGFLGDRSQRNFGEMLLTEAGGVIRPNGFLLYSTSLAISFVLCTRIILLQRRTLSFVSGAFLATIALTRNPAISAVVGLATDKLFGHIANRGTRRTLFYIILLATAGIYIAAFFTDLLSPLMGQFDQIVRRGDTATVSTDLRATVYMDSIADLAENDVLYPFFGFSDVRYPDFFITRDYTIPLGSHSTYLAVLYRYGFIGLFAFVALLLCMAGPAVRLGQSGSVITLFMLMATEDILLDPVNFYLVAVLLGLLSRLHAVSSPGNVSDKPTVMCLAGVA